ncbi:MAG: class I SAM-dependent methyltransferase [Acidimicrobiales bacterium]
MIRLVNRLLSSVGATVVRQQRPPSSVRREYAARLGALRRRPPERFAAVVGDSRFDLGDHPAGYVDWECAFTAEQLRRIQPGLTLDVGSYRHFVMGLLAHYSVTTVDVRSRQAMLTGESVVTCDAKDLRLPDASFDAVVSLCALEHFGLGRYGDDFDIDADLKAFGEMLRVLKPGGRIIFTTTVRRGEPLLAFNAHRIYSFDLLRSLTSGLSCEEERFFSRSKGGFCALSELPLTDSPDGGSWDVYCGCWRKGLPSPVPDTV